MEYTARIKGTPPSNDDWRAIPGVDERYQINIDGEIRRLCKYRGHKYDPHYNYLRPDGNNVQIMNKKYNLLNLRSSIFGVSFVEENIDELWVDIKGFEGLYMVSNKGRVKSVTRKVVHGDRTRFTRERIIKTWVINSGYERVRLHKDSVVTPYLVHRLVAEHFLEQKPGQNQVNHKDENKLNNDVANLEWCDKVYNCNYGTNQERRVASRRRNNGGKY